MGKRERLTLIQCWRLQFTFENRPKKIPMQTELEVEGIKRKKKCKSKGNLGLNLCCDTLSHIVRDALCAPDFHCRLRAQEIKTERDLGL